MWRVYLLSALVAGVVAAFTDFLTVQITKETGQASNNGTIILEGEAHLDVGAKERIVYYKVPFASPPYLSGTGMEHYKITDQKAESFTIQRPPAYASEVILKWKAEGRPSR
jgi:hypothetical protein